MSEIWRGFLWTNFVTLALTREACMSRGLFRPLDTPLYRQCSISSARETSTGIFLASLGVKCCRRCLEQADRTILCIIIAVI